VINFTTVRNGSSGASANNIINLQDT